MKKYILSFLPLYVFVASIFMLVVTIGNRTVTVLSDNQPIVRTIRIVIDAGHGGEDGGATSCTGKLESQINLEIAMKLDALCHFLGFETKMIRTTDVSVYTEGNTIAAKKASDLRHRVQMVNETENAILISIHQNTFSDRRYSGAQVFYAETEGSQEFAKLLQTQLSVITPGNHRRIKPADKIYLMQRIQKTGVLIECGFLSNPSEEALLRSANYQKKLCSAIVSGLCMYLDS